MSKNLRILGFSFSIYAISVGLGTLLTDNITWYSGLSVLVTGVVSSFLIIIGSKDLSTKEGNENV